MYPLKIAMSSYAIIGATLIIVALSVGIYLLRLRSKSRATRALIIFFGCIALSGIATLLTNSLMYWGRLFTPWQDFWILAGGIALTQFTYSIPNYKKSNESKAITMAISSLTASALIYCLVFDYNFLINQRIDIDVSDYFYLLLPLGIITIVILFFTRSSEISAQFHSANVHLESGTVLDNLMHPHGNDAKMLRAFGFALLLAFLPAIQTLLSFPPPYGFILSNLGSILAIITIALVYLNYAPDINSFLAKIVGVTLATVLLIFAVYGSIDVYNETSDYSRNRTQLLITIYDVLLKSGEVVANPPQVAYIVSWDALNPQNPDRYSWIFQSKEKVNFDLNKLIKQNNGEFLENWIIPVNGSLPLLNSQKWQSIQRFWTYPVGSTHEDYLGYIFTNQDVTYEIGFASTDYYEFTSQIVSGWIFLLLVSHIFVILVFPTFFRRTLVRPLGNLLNGIAQVNQGDMDIVIPVSSNDEIGFLTQSFNRMVGSLKGLTFKLKEKASNLENQVNLRTMELIQANELLIAENNEKIQAEAKIKQQYNYQQTLANCSRSLLINPEDGKTQQEILNQALEYLRSGVKASRAYIFRNINGVNKDLFFSMLAEVCAPGISAHIQNPINQKFPAYQLPKDFINKLSIGEKFGGVTEEIFKSTPDLLDALLSQSEPLLSMQCFPIFLDDHWWGFIGFDDCLIRRRWNVWETTLLQTASEMIGNTIKRWEIEGLLMETLDQLDQRVLRRTEALNNSNILLNKEIKQRQEAQKELETRLLVEKQLALISTRLLEPTDIRNNIKKSLENLADIMHAGRSFMIEFEPNNAYQLREFLQWHLLDIQPLKEESVRKLINSLIGFQKRMGEGKTIFIKDTSKYQSTENVDLSPLRERNVKSLVLSPLIIDQNMRGVLGCSNLLFPADQMEVDISALELVAGMLISLLQREYLIQSLEEQVAERTHQMTTFLDMTMLKEPSHDLADILQPTLLSIIQIVDCDAVVIYITNEEESKLELTAQRGISFGARKYLDEIELNANLANWLRKNESIERSGNLILGSDFPNRFFIQGYHSFLGSPIHTDRLLFGLLNCYRIANQPFSPFQKTFVSALGDLLGIIIENHHLKIEAEELATVEERQRLAREIHDAISQSVYSLSLFARSANDAVGEGDQKKLISNLEDIETTALQAMREMRLLLYQLRESGKDKDIASSLRNRFQQVENRLGIQAIQNVDPNINYPPKIRYEIWRILVESLNNIVKHANATRVFVEIACKSDHLSVLIQDNGKGFDVNAYSPGMGLKNIQTRAESVGGTLEITSKIGEGTNLLINIPMNCGNSEMRN